MVTVSFNSRTWKHLGWIMGGFVFVFALPYICLNLLNMPLDYYYFVFAALSITFLAFYRKYSSFKIRNSLKSGWALGLITALFIGLGFISYNMTDSSGFFQTLRNANFITIFWRGVVFGLLSSLMITAFPFVATWRALAGSNPGSFRKLGVIAIAAIFVVISSFSYSLGMAGFDKDNIENQVKLNFIAGLPTLLSGNPLASPIAGTFLKVSETVRDTENINIKAVSQDSDSGGIN